MWTVGYNGNAIAGHPYSFAPVFTNRLLASVHAQLRTITYSIRKRLRRLERPYHWDTGK